MGFHASTQPTARGDRTTLTILGELERLGLADLLRLLVCKDGHPLQERLPMKTSGSTFMQIKLSTLPHSMLPLLQKNRTVSFPKQQ